MGVKRRAAAQAMVQHIRRAGTVLVSDTTLRDGEQAPGVDFNPGEKVAIAKALERIGVHSIDAGFAAASPDDFQSLRMIARAAGNIMVMSLSRMVPDDIDAADQALAGRPPHRRGVSLFLGVSPSHREFKLRKTQDEVVAMIESGVEYASERFQVVAFAPEDASRTEPEFLCRCYRAAIAAGATSIAFPDTVGILTPEKTRELIRLIRTEVPELDQALLAVHFHNDLGLAVANTLAAVSEGADVVQSTIGGLGERAGNAAMEEVVLALRLHAAQYGRDTKIDLSRLTELGRLVASATGISPAPTKPVFGANIFATEAGVHQDGILKHAESYLPYAPEMVGHHEGIRLVLGKHSGKRAVAHRLLQLGIQIDEAGAERLLEQIKQLPRPSDADDDKTLVSMAEQCLMTRN
jgi:2-isopropylmalate synthase